MEPLTVPLSSRGLGDSSVRCAPSAALAGSEWPPFALREHQARTAGGLMMTVILIINLKE